MRNIIYLAALGLLSLTLGACGRYLPPIAPESLAPAAVKELDVTADLQNVNFKWFASEKNQLGDDLKMIDGYNIYRKDLHRPADLINDEIKFNLIGTVNDTHLVELKKLKDAALEAGTPTRKVKVDDKLKEFTYADNTVEPGKLYAYEIIPFNQGNVEGEANKITKVLFRGTTSEIITIDQSRLEIEELE